VNVKQVIGLILKVLVLAIAMFILFSVGSALLGPKIDVEMTAEQNTQAMVAMLVGSLVDAIIVTYAILRSRQYGWKLMGIIALVFYGAKTFMSTIEAWWFMDNVTSPMIPGMFMMTLPLVLLSPPLAVWMLGKAKKPEASADTGENHRLIMPAGQWAWKLAMLAIIVYPWVYIIFGYYVAFKAPAVQEFYGGTDPGSFAAQIAHLARTSPGLWPWQIFRGLLWIGFALPLIRTTKGRAWETGLILALFYGISMNTVHFIPNPLMPRGVAMAHFWETVPSNAMWAFAIVWLLHRKHTSFRDLFAPEPQETPVEQTT
jgi:hypothetical protein